MNTDTQTSSGVQQLIDRLQQEGVEKGRTEADAVLAAARQQAVDILDQARQQADEILAHAAAGGGTDAHRWRRGRPLGGARRHSAFN